MGDDEKSINPKNQSINMCSSIITFMGNVFEIVERKRDEKKKCAITEKIRMLKFECLCNESLVDSSDFTTIISFLSHSRLSPINALCNSRKIISQSLWLVASTAAASADS
jgi:hypothetical protein